MVKTEVYHCELAILRFAVDESMEESPVAERDDRIEFAFYLMKDESRGNATQRE